MAGRGHNGRHDSLYVDPGRARITVGKWSQRWLATKVDLKPSTRARYVGLLRVNVLRWWESVQLGDTTREALEGGGAAVAVGSGAGHGASGTPRAVARSLARHA